MKNIKSIFILVFTLVFLSAGGLGIVYSKINDTSEAADPAVHLKQKNFALLVQKVPHIQVGIKTYQMMKESGTNVQDFEIVICGKVLEELQQGSAHAEVIAGGIKEGIKFTVCGLSLKKFEIKEENLLPGLTPVPNGIIRGFELQEQGYSTIEL